MGEQEFEKFLSLLIPHIEYSKSNNQQFNINSESNRTA